ncbi:MAG: hypothetical protein ACREFR_01005 [Limisphaerales bacterium]
MIALYMQQMIQSVLNCGIEGLDNRRITWTLPNTFTSPMLDSFGKRIPGKIQVTIESYEGSLPSRLRYVRTTKAGKIEYQLLFAYPDSTLPPSEVLITGRIHGKDVAYTNLIKSISWGIRTDADQGFQPANFYSMDSMRNRSYILSNGLTFLVLSNGERRLLNVPEATLDLTANRIPLVRTILLASLAVPVAITIYLAVLKIKTSKPNERKQKA